MRLQEAPVQLGDQLGNTDVFIEIYAQNAVLALQTFPHVHIAGNVEDDAVAALDPQLLDGAVAAAAGKALVFDQPIADQGLLTGWAEEL